MYSTHRAHSPPENAHMQKQTQQFPMSLNHKTPSQASINIRSSNDNSSTTSSVKIGPRAKCDQVVYEAIAKAAEIIVRSRCDFPKTKTATSNQYRDGHNLYSNTTPTTNSSRFNFEIPEVPQVRSLLLPWKRSLHVPLRLDIFYSTSDTNRILLERWCMDYIPQPHGNGQLDNAEMLSQLRQVCKRVIISLRTIHCFARMLPSYNLHCELMSGDGGNVAGDGAGGTAGEKCGIRKGRFLATSQISHPATIDNAQQNTSHQAEKEAAGVGFAFYASPHHQSNTQQHGGQQSDAEMVELVHFTNHSFVGIPTPYGVWNVSVWYHANVKSYDVVHLNTQLRIQDRQSMVQKQHQQQQQQQVGSYGGEEKEGYEHQHGIGTGGQVSQQQHQHQQGRDCVQGNEDGGVNKFIIQDYTSSPTLKAQQEHQHGNSTNSLANNKKSMSGLSLALLQNCNLQDNNDNNKGSEDVSSIQRTDHSDGYHPQSLPTHGVGQQFPSNNTQMQHPIAIPSLQPRSSSSSNIPIPGITQAYSSSPHYNPTLINQRQDPELHTSPNTSRRRRSATDGSASQQFQPHSVGSTSTASAATHVGGASSVRNSPHLQLQLQSCKTNNTGHGYGYGYNNNLGAPTMNHNNNPNNRSAHSCSPGPPPRQLSSSPATVQNAVASPPSCPNTPNGMEVFRSTPPETAQKTFSQMGSNSRFSSSHTLSPVSPAYQPHFVVNSPIHHNTSTITAGAVNCGKLNNIQLPNPPNSTVSSNITLPSLKPRLTKCLSSASGGVVKPPFNHPPMSLVHTNSKEDSASVVTGLTTNGASQQEMNEVMAGGEARSTGTTTRSILLPPHSLETLSTSPFKTARNHHLDNHNNVTTLDTETKQEETQPHSTNSAFSVTSFSAAAMGVGVLPTHIPLVPGIGNSTGAGCENISSFGANTMSSLGSGLYLRSSVVSGGSCFDSRMAGGAHNHHLNVGGVNPAAGTMGGCGDNYSDDHEEMPFACITSDAATSNTSHHQDVMLSLGGGGVENNTQEDEASLLALSNAAASSFAHRCATASRLSLFDSETTSYASACSARYPNTSGAPVDGKFNNLDRDNAGVVGGEIVDGISLRGEKRGDAMSMAGQNVENISLKSNRATTMVDQQHATSSSSLRMADQLEEFRHFGATLTGLQKS